MRYLAWTFALFLFPLFALAEPGTYSVTPGALTDDGSGGIPDGYRIYQGCDLSAQSVGDVIADDAQIGTAYAFPGDNATPPVVCAVPYNATGEGGFTNVVTLDAAPVLPGRGTIILTCEFITDTGEVQSCTGTVSP